MNIRTFDDEAFAVDAEAHFYLWCCDCNLRHLVVVEAMGKGAEDFKEKGGKIAIGMLRDDVATDMSRNSNKIVLYSRKNDKNKEKQES